MNRKIVYNQDFVIKFEWEEDKEDRDNLPYWVNFYALEAVGKGCKENEWEFGNYDLGRGADEDHKLEDFDLYYNEQNSLCDGFIKWDGCMEIHQFNHHFCGYDDFMQRLVLTIYINAKQIMGERFNSDLANF